jgi:outer membrane protein insertion porin family
MRRALFFAIAVSALGCGSKTPAAKPAFEQPPSAAGTCARATIKSGLTSDSIARIDVAGNFRVSRETMCSALQTHVGAPPDEATLARDVHALWRMKRFDDIEVHSKVDDDGLVVRVLVRERPVVRTFTITGAASMDADAARAFFGKEGEPIDFPALKAGMKGLRVQYGKLGFKAAQVAFEVVPLPGNVVDVAVTVKEGAKS